MINEKYADYAWEQTAALLAIDSPSGFTRRAAEWVKDAFEALGFPAKITTKGGVLADLGGENADDGLFLEAHSDTLGAMVAQIKGSGRLRLTAVGGMEPNNAEAENVRIYTRSGKVYDGTCQLCNASVHVNGEYGSTKRSYDTVEVVPDEDVSTAEEPGSWALRWGTLCASTPAPAARRPVISRAAFWTTSSAWAFCWALPNILPTTTSPCPGEPTSM